MGRSKRDTRQAGFKCAIDSCLRGYRDGSDNFPIHLFKFPKNESDRRLWIVKCNLSPDIDLERARICNAHFERQNYGIRRLKPGAVPTLRLCEAPPASKTNAAFMCCDGGDTLEAYNALKKLMASPHSDNDNDETEEDTESEASVDVPQLIYFKEQSQSKAWNDVHHNKSPPKTCDKLLFSSVEKIKNMEFCQNCSEKDKNEMFYESKYREMFQDFKKEKMKVQLLRRKVQTLQTTLRHERYKTLQYLTECRKRENKSKLRLEV